MGVVICAQNKLYFVLPCWIPTQHKQNGTSQVRYKLSHLFSFKTWWDKCPTCPTLCASPVLSTPTPLPSVWDAYHTYLSHYVAKASTIPHWQGTQHTCIQCRCPQMGVHQMHLHVMAHICKALPRSILGSICKEGPHDSPIHLYPHENPIGGVYVNSWHQCPITPPNQPVYNFTFPLLDN